MHGLYEFLVGVTQFSVYCALLGCVRINGTKQEVNDCSHWMLIVMVGDGMCTTNGTSFTEIGEWPFRRLPIAIPRKQALL